MFEMQLGEFEMQLGEFEMQVGEFEMQLGEFEMQVGKFPQYLEYLQRAAAAARLFRSFSNIQSQGQSPSRSNGNYCILVDLFILCLS